MVNNTTQDIQDSNEELKEIINYCDRFREKLVEEKEDSQDHSLIEQINAWEDDSIKKIQQTAERCRELVVEYREVYFQNIEQRFSRLSERIVQTQKENKLDETNLNEFKRTLMALGKRLTNPIIISIQKHAQLFIHPISIISSKNRPLTNQKPLVQQDESTFEEYGNILTGENGKGEELNQLCHPGGIFVDKNKTIFIADWGNNRIVEWKYDAKQGHVIAGGNGQGNQMNQLYRPTNVIVDQQSQSLIIADSMNKRVIRWFNGQTQEILIENICCWGLAMDKNRFLYVTDTEKNEVRKWKLEKIIENKEGTLVAGGNGKGNQLNQFNHPTFIFVDDHRSVYVSDSKNHRVMKWTRDAGEGIIVAGGNDEGSDLNQLLHPRGLLVDQWGKIYVADWGNHRIVRWDKDAAKGEIIVGGNWKGHGLNQMNSPCGLAFDFEGNLYVAEWRNHRIVRFDKSVDKPFNGKRKKY
ncbi:unnamed protein product [Adineta ricciae]|uniref:SMP-30/Gluconolactonase/LRE-like region domain-containing protein n=1 Tax=Adineta ricciae TaxID=249248 RepID=A0A815QNP1_ADIRI|nr:unnamed protein product [Adineta ricciae]